MYNEPSMRILFVVRNHSYMRTYGSVVRLLASRGHTVVIGSRGRERHLALDSDQYLADLSRAHPGVSVRILHRRADKWNPFAEAVRAVRTALRYRHPAFRRASLLAARAHSHLLKRAPRAHAAGLARPWPWPAAAALSRVAALIEAAIPTDPSIDDVFTEVRPDVMVVTPLIDFNSYQTDYVKSARRLGIPVALAVASWDNLTNKAVMPIQPDMVIVWNDAQKREAVALHGVRPEAVRVTGAQCFDEWFERRPSTTRDAFCARVGLDPAHPYVLYVCSSQFIAGRNEVPHVRQWIERLRRSSFSALRECGVLVRPHPGNAEAWATAELSEFDNVTIWPRQGELPLFEEGKAAYVDSIHHAAAVVGINSSCMIEAGIIGRASFTLLRPQFARTQAGTLHFAHLAAPGFLRTARTFHQHHAQLDAELRQPSTAASLAPFVEAFVRPFGLQAPATPRLVAAIEELAGLRTVPAMPLTARLLRPVLARMI
jgi:hypothetical protein